MLAQAVDEFQFSGSESVIFDSVAHYNGHHSHAICGWRTRTLIIPNANATNDAIHVGINHGRSSRILRGGTTTFTQHRNDGENLVRIGDSLGNRQIVPKYLIPIGATPIIIRHHVPTRRAPGESFPYTAKIAKKLAPQNPEMISPT